MIDTLTPEDKRELFRTGKEVNFALPRHASSLRPSAADIKAAAGKLKISQRHARKALSYYNFEI